ncbi:MAG: ribonuclease P protein component [Proteobacteria bacterium]|nr:ribonuclease P protein component [Pseudomonadota bacterium]
MNEGKAQAPLPSFRLHILKKRSEFKAAANGARFSTPAFTLQRKPAGDEPKEGLRFGFTVTKKVGNAVERNRIRRRLRAAVREAGPHLAQTGLDLVLVARREALAADFSTLVEDIRRAVSIVAERPKPSARRSNGPKDKAALGKAAPLA